MDDDMIPRAEADARVAAAFEAAEKICDDERYNTNMLTSNPPQSAAAVGARNRIRALTPDDARAALDQMISDAVNEATRLTVPIAALDAVRAEARLEGMLRGAKWMRDEAAQRANMDFEP